MRKLRIILICSDLTGGGIARNVYVMSDYWAAQGHCIELLTGDDGSKPDFYELDHRIIRCHLALLSRSFNFIDALRNNLRRIFLLRSEIIKWQPDVVISYQFTWNILSIIAVIGRRVPVIAFDGSGSWKNTGFIWFLLRRFIYCGAKFVVVQTERMRSLFPKIIQRKSKVIPNPVLPAPHKTLAQKDKGGSYTIINAGRLHRVKGLDRLISAFSRVAAKHPNWNLEFWGEGPDKESLEALVESLGLKSRVRINHPVKEIYEKFILADLFVMTSYVEGQPNALCEAMACGLPVISFDCPYGPRETIRNGIDGILVPDGDIEALAKAMDYLMGDDAARLRLAARAPEVLKRFGAERIMKEWDQLLDEAVKNK